MDKKGLTGNANTHLNMSLSEVDKHRNGSEEDQKISACPKKVMDDLDRKTDDAERSVVERETGGSRLSYKGNSLGAFYSHYSLACCIDGVRIVIATIERFLEMVGKLL